MPQVNRDSPQKSGTGPIYDPRIVMSLIKRVLPAITSFRVSELAVCNMQANSLSKLHSALARLNEAAITDVTSRKCALSISVDSLAELAMVAEAHRARMAEAMKLNKGAIPVKLEIRLAVKGEDKENVNASTIGRLIENMGIADIIGPTDIILVDAEDAAAVMLRDVQDALVAKGYAAKDIAIVERARDDRNDEDVPQDSAFVEYSDEFVTGYHYNAALEALSKPERPVMSDIYKRWFRIKKIQAIDYNELRLWIERYDKVQIAA